MNILQPFQSDTADYHVTSPIFQLRQALAKAGKLQSVFMSRKAYYFYRRIEVNKLKKLYRQDRTNRKISGGKMPKSSERLFTIT